MCVGVVLGTSIRLGGAIVEFETCEPLQMGGFTCVWSGRDGSVNKKKTSLQFAGFCLAVCLRLVVFVCLLIICTTSTISSQLVPWVGK